MTLNLNCVMAIILPYSTEFSSFGAYYVEVIEDRPIVCNRSPKDPLFSSL